jgi:phytoene synthase
MHLTNKSPYFYCRKIAAPLGSNRYYAARYIPFRQRKGLFGLYAFDNAVFSIPFLVNEPHVAQAKLQWWKSAIHELFETKKSEHPILKCLTPYLDKHHWQPDQFIQYINTIEHWLDFDVFETEMEMLEHSARTSGAIAAMALSLFVPSCDKSRSFASHYAFILDVNHFLLNLNFYAKHHKIPFSHELLRRLHIHDYDLAQPINSSCFVNLLDELLPLVDKHLAVTEKALPPEMYKKLRYFRIMSTLAIEQMNLVREKAINRTEVEENLDLWALKKWWVAAQTR